MLCLYYNGSKILLFVNTAKIYQIKTKEPEMKDCTLCLGNPSKDFAINNMKKKYSQWIVNG